MPITIQEGEPRTGPQGETLTPRSLLVDFGRVVWQTPLAIDVEQGGERQRVPIVDVTRIAIIAVWLAVGLTILILTRTGR